MNTCYTAAAHVGDDEVLEAGVQHKNGPRIPIGGHPLLYSTPFVIHTPTKRIVGLFHDNDRVRHDPIRQSTAQGVVESVHSEAVCVLARCI